MAAFQQQPQPSPAWAVELAGLTRRFSGGANSGAYTAIENLNLRIRPGSFVSLVGPSGCGKSTVLNLIAGLIAPSEGTVTVFGETLRGLNRRASYMFQQDALLPWKTVFDNVMLGLEFRGRTSTADKQLARDWIHRVGLDGFAAAYPHQLSGGMRKRVAMAQTWIVEPDLVLMDEPFAALDVHTRQRMEGEVLEIWAGSGKTVVFITHDLEEAIALSDEVAVLSAGPASRVVAHHSIGLPRPRNLLDLKTEPRFADLYRTIWTDMREEVLKSYERNRE